MQGFGGNLAEVEISGKNAIPLDVVAAPKTRRCIKCGAPHVIGAVACAKCGVDFARVALQQQQLAQHRPRYSAMTDAERKVESRARGNTAVEKAGKPPRELDVGLFLMGAVVCGVLAGVAWMFVNG